MKCTPLILIVCFLIALPLASVQAQTQRLSPSVSDGSLAGYKLVWHDEFNGKAVNTKEWNYRTGERFWSMQRPENVSVADGKLRLALKKEKFGNTDYTAGGLISKREFKFGYYEARLKMPRGKGWHTSFWMMRNADVAVRDQELDVCEQDSINPNDYSTNVHGYKPKPKAQGAKHIATPDLTADFHVWGCEFTARTVTYYFDGKVVDTRDVTNVPLGDVSIWLTSIAAPLGKTDKVDDSTLPAFAEFDYVRFFARPVIGKTILVFGDSLTEGNALPVEERASAWIRLADARSNRRLHLINEGKGGRSTDSVSEFKAMLQRHAVPAALTILLGTNDSRDVSGECVPKAVANITDMVLAARNAYGDKLPILLIGPPNINKAALGPTRPIADQREANLRELGVAYEKLAQELNCQFVNAFGVIPAESLLKDGVHPDTKGNAALADKLLPALLRLAEKAKAQGK